MASMNWALLRCTMSFALSSSSLWQKSMVVLTVSNHSRGMSFSPVANLRVWLVQPWGAWGCETKEMLTTSSVFGMVGWSSRWVMWVKLGVPAGVAACGDICWRVAIEAGKMESAPSGLSGSSVLLAEDRAPRATDGGCLPGVLCH